MKSRDYKRFEFVIEKIQKIYKKNMKILDIGPGDGMFCSILRELGYNVSSLDIKNKDFEWKHFVINIDKSYIPEKFDIIHAGEVLEHTKNPHKAIKYILKMAKSSTLIFISVPNFIHPSHRRYYTKQKFKRFICSYINVEIFVVFTHKREGKKNTKQYLIVGKKKKI